MRECAPSHALPRTCRNNPLRLHLIRDLNQDLLPNLLDEQPKVVIPRVGSLLRAILTTLDAQGLTRKYLKPHEAEVEHDFMVLCEPTLCPAGAAARWGQKTKGRDTLWLCRKF